jgi:CheY-like chemotaxis protein
MDGYQAEEAQVPFILIVEDDPDCQQLWGRYLGTVGCHTRSTRRGLEALEWIQNQRPAAVVLDVMLPDMDGWHVLGAIRGDSMTQDIPVVMCSALEERESRMLMASEAAAASGAPVTAEDYLRKLVSRHTFLSALARLGVCAEPQ